MQHAQIWSVHVQTLLDRGKKIKNKTTSASRLDLICVFGISKKKRKCAFGNGGEKHFWWMSLRIINENPTYSKRREIFLIYFFLFNFLFGSLFFRPFQCVDRIRKNFWWNRIRYGNREPKIQLIVWHCTLFILWWCDRSRFFWENVLILWDPTIQSWLRQTRKYPFAWKRNTNMRQKNYGLPSR